MKLAKRVIVSALWHTMGRTNLVRLSRFLANESRLDSSNDMGKNGEQLVQAIVLRNSQRSPVVFIDVGANVGIWTRAAMAHRSSGQKLKVHAFEPCAGTVETLRANLVRWDIASDVRVNCIAASSSTGTAIFYSSGANVGINGLYADQHRNVQHTSEVTAVTLDSYCREQCIAEIDMLKIDAEGHDMKVLEGATGLFTGQRIGVAQFEYNQRWISARNYLRDVFDMVGHAGYTVGKITPLGIEFYERWHYELETFREANFVAVRSEYRALFPQVKWWNH